MFRAKHLVILYFAALLPTPAMACFKTPNSKPLIGCMPFSFEASGPGDSVDWGLYRFTQRIEKTDEELDEVQIAKKHRAYYPQEACARRASNIHISLIERLYGQMQNGQAPNAFAETNHGLDLSIEGQYDGRAAFKIKDFTPEFVREYYPSLFAIIREFEGCMIDIMDQGCANGPDSCRILDFRWMGYLPDGNQFAYVEKIPDFPSLSDEEAAAQDCEQTTGFGDCADGGAFASDSESYAAFGTGTTESAAQAKEMPGPLGEVKDTDSDKSERNTFENILENFVPTNSAQELRNSVFRQALEGLEKGEITFDELPDAVQKEIIVTGIGKSVGAIAEKRLLINRIPILGDDIVLGLEYIAESISGVLYDISSP